MRRWLVILFGCGWMVGSVNCCWCAEKQEELLKKIEGLEQQLKELKAMQRIGAEKESHCMRVFGREKFCRCIGESLPRDASLEQYVHTVVTPKEVLGYDGMSMEQKKMVDQTLAARDKCAEKEKGGFLW